MSIKSTVNAQLALVSAGLWYADVVSDVVAPCSVLFLSNSAVTVMCLDSLLHPLAWPSLARCVACPRRTNDRTTT